MDDHDDDDYTSPLRRRRKRPDPDSEQRRSEVHVPLDPGALIRARYLGPGGGALNLYCGEHIALHVNPRPHEGLVLNSHFGGWGPEERPDDYPFEYDEEIVLTVRVRGDHFVITARAAGGEAFTYNYRVRHPAGARLDRLTIDIPRLFALAIQPPA